MKRRLYIGLSCLILFLGIGMLSYPIISNYLYQNQQNELMDFYQKKVAETSPDLLQEEKEACQRYNQSINDGSVILTDPFDKNQVEATTHPYVDLLNVNNDGIMGTIEIPSIDVKISIYHGTSEEVLQKGVGHLQGSSLPVGGKGTHAVLSGHTGMADKKLFTDLDQLKEGSIFYLHILDKTLAYQVNQIKVVSPEDTSDLKINSEEDYVTLVTCTPYGVNSHRLLVRGTRIDYKEAKKKQSDNKEIGWSWVRDYIIAIAVCVFVILCILIVRFVKKRKR